MDGCQTAFSSILVLLVLQELALLPVCCKENLLAMPFLFQVKFNNHMYVLSKFLGMTISKLRS